MIQFLIRKYCSYRRKCLSEVIFDGNFRSTIKRNTAAPEWDDEEWIVRNIPRHAKLVVKLFDKDDDKIKDDYIGRFIISDLIDEKPPEKGYKILGAFGQYSGRFYLSIHTMQSTEETRRLPRYTFDGPCRYFRHDSVAIGRLTMLNADCVYSTWKIQLKRISVFFPTYERQHWNRQYHAARNIFGGCPLALASQGTIKVAHKVLYGRTLKHNENGRLNTVDDLWKSIFTDRITKKIEPRLFTYIIDDNTWRFSETGHRFFTDFASKHALMANCSRCVRYAGEFHARPKYGWDRVDDDDDDEWELVFDNGSGTYAPSADLLENLQALLTYNFPGLNVVTYDYKDSALKESVERLKFEMEKKKHILLPSNNMYIRSH